MYQVTKKRTEHYFLAEIFAAKVKRHTQIMGANMSIVWIYARFWK